MKIIFAAVIAFCAAVIFGLPSKTPQPAIAQSSTIRIGWVGPMSGPTAKYGAYQSAILAQEDINASGGINGQRIELVFQDAKGNSREAVSGVNYLLNVEKIRFIVGGHCTPESLPISSIVNRAKAIMLAAITSSPKLTDAGDYVFRVTAVNTQGVDLLLPHIVKHSTARNFAVLYEETDYAQGLGEYFRDQAPKRGINVLTIDGFSPGETDFRTLLTKYKQMKADGIYLSVQAPDTAVIVRRQMQDVGYLPLITGNELTGNAAKTEDTKDFDGMFFPEPDFDRNDQPVAAFIERFKKRFGVNDIPYGFWTIEAYDAVQVMAKMVGECGPDIEAVKQCFYQTKNYPGISGPIGFDEHGDGIRRYIIKTVKDGQVVSIH